MGTNRDHASMLNQKYVTKRPSKKPKEKKSPWTKMGKKEGY